MNLTCMDAYDNVKDCLSTLYGIEQILYYMIIAESLNEGSGENTKELFKLLDQNIISVLENLESVFNNYFNQ